MLGPIGTSANPDDRLAEQVGDDRARTHRAELGAEVLPWRPGDDPELPRRVDHQLGVDRRRPVDVDVEGRVPRGEHLLDEVDAVELD